jgi:hypothetical protein
MAFGVKNDCGSGVKVRYDFANEKDIKSHACFIGKEKIHDIPWMGVFA